MTLPDALGLSTVGGECRDCGDDFKAGEGLPDRCSSCSMGHAQALDSLAADYIEEEEEAAEEARRDDAAYTAEKTGQGDSWARSSEDRRGAK